ncbi:hypothetical protein HUJ04_000470 [Dendroctonus ponderosae]|nr:hypothetical protein HUJ04_000470 [Dendroctonus ponderosae]
MIPPIAPGQSDLNQDMVGWNNTFNMRPFTLLNLAANTLGMKNGAKVTIQNHRKSYSVTSATKSLDLLRKNVQMAINKDIDNIIKKYLDKFFQPAVVNIKVNLGSDSVTEENIRDICKKILEEAKSMYIIPLREKEQSGFEYCSNEQGFECTDARFSHFESVGLIGHQAQKRKDVQLETDSSVSLLPLKRSKSKLLSNYYNDNLGCKFSLKRDGPKWNPERIKAHTQFIMGSRANKVLGYGQTRGRLYVRHPNLLRYCGDQEDKEWLQSQNLLPANGGKIYIMLLQDIQELTESDEYCNNPNLQLQELQGFEAPMFMCDKIRNFLEYIKNEKKLMAVLDVDENSSEITTVLPDTDERSEKNVWRTSQLRQQIDYPNMSSDMSTLSSSVISTKGQRSPTISFISQTQIKDIGGTVELSCSVQYTQDYSVVWMKLDTGSSLPISTGSSLILHDSRFSLRYDPASSTYVLQIKDMQETDAGTYACQILISPSNRVSAEVQVQVRRPPFISDNSTRSVVVAEGSGGSISRGNTLKIKGIKKEDRGTYYCIAENGVGQGARRNIAVEVEFAPVVTVPRPRLGQALQYDMDLECHVEAYPLPAITWEKDDITLVNNQHNMISHFAVADEFTDTTLRDSLFDFVRFHISDADLNLIDDIVLSYVIAFLEDVGDDSHFDVEGFCEMMEAYFPKFATINHSTVCEWMFDLEEKLRKIDEAQVKSPNLDISLPEVVSSKTKPRSHSDSESFETPKRVHKLSEMSDGGSTDSSCCDFPDEMDILQEMFPSICTIEVKQCLAIAAGDIERATQILIDRQENGQCLSQNSTLTLQVAKQTIDDAELKSRIIERYSYIDKDALNKEYRPVAPKVEPKKLVRYRDNKIVSLKGERYTEVKKGDDVEDISLKKNKKGQAHSP